MIILRVEVTDQLTLKENNAIIWAYSQVIYES